MQAIPLATLKDNLETAMDRVCDHHEVLIINRSEGRSLVLMSLEDYTNVEKTKYLYGKEKQKTDDPLSQLAQ